MKLYLKPKEKKELLHNKIITIDRYPELQNTSVKNEIYGVGCQSVWDKIDRKWIYGNCDEYIENMKNVGRRSIDYKDNAPNNINGGKWWDFLSTETFFGNIGQVQYNNRKEKIFFIITKLFVKELEKYTDDYNKIVYSIEIKLV